MRLEASTKPHVHNLIHEFLINMAFTMACPNFKKGLKMVSGPLGIKVERPKGHTFQNAYMPTTFMNFGAKSLFGGGKFVMIFMETQSLFKRTNFSFQTYINSAICIF